MQANFRLVTPGPYLAFLGRNGAVVMLFALATGLLAPEMARQWKPWLPYAMGLSTTGVFLAASYSADRAWLQTHVIFVAVWAALAPAILLGLAAGYSGLEAGVLTGILLAALAPPAFSVPSFATLLKLSPKLALAAFVAATLAAPLTMPLLAKAFGMTLEFDPYFYALKLLAIIGGGWVCATILKRLLPRLGWLVPEQAAATGFAVIGLFVVFAVSAALARQQWELGGNAFVTLIGIAAALNVVLMLIGSLVFSRLGLQDALTAGLLSGNRNAGLALAAGGATLPAKGEAYLAASLMIIALMPITFQQTTRLVNFLRRRPELPRIDITWWELNNSAPPQSRALEAGNTYRIGRGLDCEIVLPGNTVSRLHAELSIAPDGTVAISDLGSTNGIWTNGAYVEQARLGPRNTVQIGMYVLRLGQPDPLEIVAEWHHADQPANVHTKVLADGGTYNIGRNPDADIRLVDRWVSDMHAQISIGRSGQVTIADLGSTNGVLVAGVRVPEVRLDQTAEVQIGLHRLRIRSAAAGDAQ